MTNAMNYEEASKALFRAELNARWYPGEEKKDSVEVQINGNTFSVEYIVVNRKCFDHLATPTSIIKMNGKRISRKAAYDSLK